MYCEYCGTKLEDGAAFCPSCGVKLGDGIDPMTGHPLVPKEEPKPDPEATRRNGFITFISVILPLLGLILWLAWRKTKSGLALSAAKGALIFSCFAVPVLGLILFLTKKESNREIAKACGISAIVGEAFAVFIAPMFIYIVMILLIVF